MTLKETSQEKALMHQEYYNFSALLSEYGEPQKFQEAWHKKYPVECEGWRKSTRKELNYTINKGVRRKPKIINMPPNIHLIDSKWVFKKKRDGQFRACLVARGYT